MHSEPDMRELALKYLELTRLDFRQRVELKQKVRWRSGRYFGEESSPNAAITFAPFVWVSTPGRIL
jgi:hypothetical protein